MIEVVVKDLGPNEVMDIVRELRRDGLVQGKDFDFTYHPSKYDYFSGDAEVNKHTVFTFHTEKYATFFALKYGS